MNRYEFIGAFNPVSELPDKKSGRWLPINARDEFDP